MIECIQKYDIPSKRKPAFDLRQCVYQSSDRAQRAYCDSIGPFRIRVFVFLVCLIEISGIEANDGNGEDELEKANGEVQ